MRYSRYHALGNDCIVVHPSELSADLDPDVIRPFVRSIWVLWIADAVLMAAGAQAGPGPQDDGAHARIAARSLDVPEKDLIVEMLPAQDSVEAALFYVRTVPFYDAPRMGILFVNNNARGKEVAWRLTDERWQGPRGDGSSRGGVRSGSWRFSLPPGKPAFLRLPGPTDLCLLSKRIRGLHRFDLSYEAAPPAGTDPDEHLQAKFDLHIQFTCAESGTDDERDAALDDIRELIRSATREPADIYRCGLLLRRAGQHMETEELCRLVMEPLPAAEGFPNVGGHRAPIWSVLGRRTKDPALLGFVTEVLKGKGRSRDNMILRLGKQGRLRYVTSDTITSLLREVAISEEEPVWPRLWAAQTLFERGAATRAVGEMVRELWRTQRRGLTLLVLYQQGEVTEAFRTLLTSHSTTRVAQSEKRRVMGELASRGSGLSPAGKIWALRLLKEAMGNKEKMLPMPRPGLPVWDAQTLRRQGLPVKEGHRICDYAAACALRVLSPAGDARAYADTTALTGGWRRLGTFNDERIPAAPPAKRDEIILRLKQTIDERITQIQRTAAADSHGGAE